MPAAFLTRKDYDEMEHYGNVSNINGAEIEPVDVITFGSPCQDMSIAGKREGMKHAEQGDEETTRSGLFYEAVRIIEEMRKATNGEYPKYAVWENVPGAFSSNKGRDFHAVLEALCSVCDDTVSIPEPYDKKRTKLVWAKAGEIVGDNYSVAWRTLDAQYWGVPQRRKRIYLVADFTSKCAGKILFKQESLRGDLQTSDEAGQEVAADAMGSVDGSVGAVGLTNRGIECETAFETLRAGSHGALPLVAQTVYSFDSLSSNSMKSSNPNSGCRAVEIAKCIDTTYPDPSKNQGGIAVVQPLILKERAGCEGGGKGALWSDKAFTLATNQDMSVISKSAGFKELNGAKAYGNAYEEEKAPTLTAGKIDASVVILNDQGGSSINIEREEASPTLRANSHQHEPVIAFAQNQREEVRDLGGKAGALAAEAGAHQQTYVAQPVIALQANGIDRADTAGCNGCGWRENESYTLNTIDRHAVCFEPGAMVRDMGNRIWTEQSPTLRAKMGDNQPAVCFDRATFNQGVNAQYDFEVSQEGVVSTVVAKGPSGVCYDARGNGDGETACTITGDHQNRITDYTAGAVQETYTMQRSDEYQKCNVASTQSARQYKSATDLVVEKKRKYIIRRLTPTECARLQGFPDTWGHLAPYDPADAEFWEDVRKTHAEVNGKTYKPVKDIKKWYDKLHTDSAEYKMWGNGIALPNAEFVLHGIAEQGAKTLGSLFDGSGGFPLAGALNGIKPLWASEVEPYPIAVTKSRFKEAQNG